MLAIAVHYLSGRVYAGRFDDSGSADWPPDSAKLFFAAVSTLHATGNQSDARMALLWLESQPAPAMWFSDAVERNGMVAYVPRNDTRALELPEDEHRNARAFPSVQPETPIVYYIWPDAEPRARDPAIVR